jgi:predicted nicotinamide N-methyase
MAENLPDRISLAGHAAHWRSVTIEVAEDRDGTLVTLPCDPISLYMLEDPERSIDAAALLRERVIEDPPYWALVWTGAQAIAAFVANMPAPRARVLDLGCGLGLSGLAAARRESKVTFGDYLEEPLNFVRATIRRLGITNGEVRAIDFTDPRDDGSRFDLILAADIVYDPAHYESLSDYLQAHLAESGTILLTESLRADARVFVDGMRARGFHDRKRALRVLEDGRHERTWLHELRPATTDE